MSLQGGAHSAGSSSREYPANEAIEIRLPPRREYIPVLRATVGVIAGSMSFNYDEIVQIRTAVAEAFGLAVAPFTPQEITSGAPPMVVTFAIQPDRLAIELADPRNGISHMSVEEGEESKALLKSLVDELEMGPRADGERVIRLVIYKTSVELQGPTGGRGLR